MRAQDTSQQKEVGDLTQRDHRAKKKSIKKNVVNIFLKKDGVHSCVEVD